MYIIHSNSSQLASKNSQQLVYCISQRQQLNCQQLPEVGGWLYQCNRILLSYHKTLLGTYSCTLLQKIFFDWTIPGLSGCPCMLCSTSMNQNMAIIRYGASLICLCTIPNSLSLQITSWNVDGLSNFLSCRQTLLDIHEKLLPLSMKSSPLDSR